MVKRLWRSVMRLGGYDKVHILLPMIQNHSLLSVHLKLISLLVIIRAWCLFVNLINSIILELGQSIINHTSMQMHLSDFEYTQFGSYLHGSGGLLFNLLFNVT